MSYPAGTEGLINMDITLIIWKSDLINKIKRNFFPAVTVSLLLQGYTTWTLARCWEKRLDSSKSKILHAGLNKSWKQQSTKQQLYSHLPPILLAIEVISTKQSVHCRRSKDELISNVLSWTTTSRHTCVCRPGRNYKHQLCADTACSLEDLRKMTDDKDGW